MKNKSILIIGIAVGNPTVVKKFNHTILRMATSKKTMFNSAFGDLDKIVDQLVDASCTPFKPGNLIITIMLKQKATNYIQSVLLLEYLKSCPYLFVQCQHPTDVH